MSFKWDDKPSEPMNPYAKEDFRKAIEEAVDKIKHNFNEFPKDESKVIPKPIWDMPAEYSGAMRLCYCNGRGAWQDVMFTLIAHGYEVTARLEDATETEKELDGADKFVIIEYEKVE